MLECLDGKSRRYDTAHIPVFIPEAQNKKWDTSAHLQFHSERGYCTWLEDDEAGDAVDLELLVEFLLDRVGPRGR